MQSESPQTEQIDAFRVRQIAEKAIGYVEHHDYFSYDNFDALTSPLLFALSGGQPFVQRILIQANARTPFGLRWAGVRKKRHNKTLSDMMLVYAWLLKEQKDPDITKRLARVASLLRASSLQEGDTMVWGLNMPYATRFIKADATTPNLYTTVCAGKGFAALFRINRENETAETLRAIVRGILRYFHEKSSQDEQTFLQYYSGDRIPVPNVNAIALQLLSEINHLLGEEITHNNLLKGLRRFILSAQESNGAWYYSSEEKGRWADGFHTGFILDSLMEYNNLEPSMELQQSIRKGFRFFVDQFISPENIPNYHPGKFRMMDSQNNAQIIQTLVTGSAFFCEDRVAMIQSLLRNILANMYDPSGYFYFQKKNTHTIKTPYFRWSQTPMILALLYAEEYLKKNAKS